MFRIDNSNKVYFTGRFDRGVPRETFERDKAQEFLSAAHAYKFGSEHRALQSWRVGRV